MIADHIRACSFLIIDGVMPSNEGRGYVLRRIMRRAIRHGYKLGKRPTFFYKLVTTLAKVMGGAFPELVEKQACVRERAAARKGSIRATRSTTGMEILDAAIARLEGGKASTARPCSSCTTPTAFPLDLTADIARERGLHGRHARLRSAR